MKLNSICVYCGSSPGRSSIYREAAQALGAEISRRKIHLIYGGASVGLMGETARAALEGGAKVTGVIPQVIADQEIAYKGLDELIVVNSMHERKAKMAELADGFIALPGGPGTLDEVFEVWNAMRMGLHKKPCGLLNTKGYFDKMIEFIEQMVEEEFLSSQHKMLVKIADSPNALLNVLFP